MTELFGYTVSTLSTAGMWFPSSPSGNRFVWKRVKPSVSHVGFWQVFASNFGNSSQLT